MNYYYYRLKSDKLTIVTVVVLTIFMISDVFILNYQWPVQYDVIQSTFLVTNSEGHLMHRVVFWVLPIYLLLTSSSWYSIDNRVGYDKILMLRFEKKKYLRLNILIAFINSFFLIFIPLMINYLFAFIINKDGTESPINMSDEMTRNNIMRELEFFTYDMKIEIFHPIISIFSHIILTSLFVGILGVFISCLSFIMPKLRYLTFMCLMLWYVAITGGYSVLLAFQPFTEYAPLFRLELFGMYSLILLVISYVLYRYKIYVDEL